MRLPRLLVPSAALLWGLQFAFLNPALALLLVALFHASDAEVGLALALYNASGFVASLVMPAYADRTHDYLRPMLVCSTLALVVAALLLVASSLPLAVVLLVALGGPASVGSSLLFAHLRANETPLAQMMNTRAIVSFAWVAGPPLATLLIGSLGERSILIAIAAIAVLAFATTAALRNRANAAGASAQPQAADDDAAPLPRGAVAVVVLAFIALQATNNVVVSIMALFTTQRLGLGIEWAGIALGVAAALEIPALFAIGKLTKRFSSLRLLASGCAVGVAYYAAMAFVSGPVLLVAVQVLNAWFFAVVAGVGLTYFQQIIPRPGLASGLFTNTRRLGAIVSGGVIGFGSTLFGGYSGVFWACAALTIVALAAVLVVPRISRISRRVDRHAADGAGPSRTRLASTEGA
ncbi:MFS transporter [Sinomonas sp. ASV322]|uniref:MFS transporter n=1 Tax=Sinomonas sp. ASV322 TaxID=3041920 RepID=UPI0027DB6662|nr:MFS transporter [Sinomonas sp. ASV322]MDQ4503419.1 MFS transporter [Sinomonas sp. ASV322]